jgi:hypothetical protein
MEFKTSELNGILLSIAEAPAGSPSLSIEVYNGKVSETQKQRTISMKQMNSKGGDVVRPRQR